MSASPAAPVVGALAIGHQDEVPHTVHSVSLSNGMMVTHLLYSSRAIVRHDFLFRGELVHTEIRMTLEEYHRRYVPNVMDFSGFGTIKRK